MTLLYAIGVHSPTVGIFLKLYRAMETSSCSVREDRSHRTRMLLQSEAEGLSLESQSLVCVCIQRMKMLESQEVGVRPSGLLAVAMAKITLA